MGDPPRRRPAAVRRARDLRCPSGSSRSSAYEDAVTAIAWLERAFGFEEDRGGAIRGGRDDRRTPSSSSAARGSSLDARAATRTRRGCARPRSSPVVRYDNPWVIDGHFVEVDDVEAPLRTRVAPRARRSSATSRSPGSASASTPPRTSRAIAGCSGSDCEQRPRPAARSSSNELEAEMVRSLLEDARASSRCSDPTDVAAAVVRRHAHRGGPREVLVACGDLETARELVASQ